MDPVLEFLNKRGCVGLYLYYSDATGVGSSPLAVACMLNHSLAAWSLIEKGEHLQYRGGYRRTLLHFTFSNKLDRSKDFIKYYRVERKAEIVSLLFNAGLDISTPDEDGKQYFTLQPALRGAAIHYASEIGDYDSVIYLIEQGAEINIGCSSGWTPLHHAADRGHYDIVRVLVEKGAGINKAEKSDRTAPSYAAAKAYHDAIIFLLENGVDIQIADYNGHTPLFQAVRNDNNDLVRTLI
ncbi:uncharacterized protein LAJ45_10731 [Morchella importuna]|uniref:uncharacterized protein n=1 Tax=Morchella importuna TaxID=1174673 RepID=UPI001E8D8595|nr:uncharacterized protein LAJ45_10731 [Morchella importuna]KAH8145294.1 hypothetical protein LAJ45_10731 [Morchella importuna]